MNVCHIPCVCVCVCVWLLGGGEKGGKDAISRCRPQNSRRVNGTLIHTGACRKELRGRLFSPFLEEYGGDSPRRKAKKLPDRPWQDANNIFFKGVGKERKRNEWGKRLRHKYPHSNTSKSEEKERIEAFNIKERTKNCTPKYFQPTPILFSEE
jgi:hypothetical protein